MSKMVKVPGIVVSATSVRSKATKLTLQCRSCKTSIPNIEIKPGFEGYSLPRKCTRYSLIVLLVNEFTVIVYTIVLHLVRLKVVIPVHLTHI